MSAGGTPLPTEGRLSGRVDHEPSQARPAPARSALLLRSLRQTSRLEPFRPHRRTSRTLASIEDRQGEAQARSTRLNSSHANISYAVFCLKKKKTIRLHPFP